MLKLRKYGNYYTLSNGDLKVRSIKIQPSQETPKFRISNTLLQIINIRDLLKEMIKKSCRRYTASKFVESQCLFGGGKGPNGYQNGCITVEIDDIKLTIIGQMHVFAFYAFPEYFVDAFVPHGLMVCHHCDVPACCNPEHLYLGTSSNNGTDAATRRMMAARELHTWRLDALIVPLIRFLSGENPFRIKLMSQTHIAHCLGFSQATISEVCKRKRYTQVTMNEFNSMLKPAEYRRPDFTPKEDEMIALNVIHDSDLAIMLNKTRSQIHSRRSYLKRKFKDVKDIVFALYRNDLI